MKKFFSHRGDWVFGSLALVFFALLVGYAICTISFIAGALNETLGAGSGEKQLIEHFDFDKLSQLVGSPLPPEGL